MNPPIAKLVPVQTTYHATRVLSDNYAWLKQKNWKEMFQDTSLLEPDIKDYLEAENAYTQNEFTAPYQGLIDELVDEMKSRVEINYDTAPVLDGPYSYFTRYSDADYPVFLRRDHAGKEETLLDTPREFAPNGEKVFLGDLAHSPDHRFLAAAIDFSGSEDHDILIKDLSAQTYIAEKLMHSDGIVWHPSSAKFYYMRMSDASGEFRRNRVFCHVLGTPQELDMPIFQSDDPSYYLGLSQTSDKAFLIITLQNSTSTELHILDMRLASPELICLAPRSANILYDIAHARGVFFIRTNASEAVEFKIMTAPASTPQIENWEEYVPHKRGRLIRSIRAFANQLVRCEYQDCLPRLVVSSLADQATHEVTFADPAYYATVGNAKGFESDWMRIVYSSPRTPTQYFDYNMETRERVVVHQEHISSHKPEDYSVERVFVESFDGAKVPLTVLRNIKTPLDGTAPVLLYGYGSYGAILHSHFSHYNPSRYALLNRGFIFVDAHVRGGADMGHQWYLDGKLMSKKNTFRDFIASAQWLVENKYTSKGKIVAEGGSAGGLLMGAVANMAEPGLFGGMISAVPFVDVMNTILDDKLPLTPPEWKEWGNPIESAEAFDYMRSYSPYDNVTPREYPAMFISGGLTDPRVTYWEPAKWAAKLRAHQTGKNPIYLHISMDSGHGGDPGRFSHLPEVAREVAFCLQVAGSKKSA